MNTPRSIIITSTQLGSNLEDLHRISGIVKNMLFLNSSARRTHVPGLAAVAMIAHMHGERPFAQSVQG